MATFLWGKEVAEVYDLAEAEMFDPAVLGPTVDRLAELAGPGPALELAVGTGRVALALSALGVPVQGIELSPHMAAQLRAKPGAEAVPVTLGDMATTRVEGRFQLVYLIYNTIQNVTTQDEQVAVFANAAAHLVPGGCFVVEVGVPRAGWLPRGELGRVFAMDDDHVGIDTYEDILSQRCWSHHWTAVEGRLLHNAMPFRYVWPAELDLMARLAGLRLRDRWSGWDGRPFDVDRSSQVVVYEKPLEGDPEPG